MADQSKPMEIKDKDKVIPPQVDQSLRKLICRTCGTIARGGHCLTPGCQVYYIMSNQQQESH